MGPHSKAHRRSIGSQPWLSNSAWVRQPVSKCFRETRRLYHGSLLGTWRRQEATGDFRMLLDRPLDGADGSAPMLATDTAANISDSPAGFLESPRGHVQVMPAAQGFSIARLPRMPPIMY